MANIRFFCLLCICITGVKSDILESASSWFNSATDAASNYYCNIRGCSNDQSAAHELDEFEPEVAKTVNVNIFESATSWMSSMRNAASNYYCSVRECCNDEGVPCRLNELEYNLKNKLFGQHLAGDIVLKAIKSHLSKEDPRKPLVMSFHGPNGVGKSFVSELIAKSFYAKGLDSRFFHFYYGLADFPYEDKVEEYQEKLKSDIESAISKCEKSLFVFDGVDQMPPSLLNILMSFIDCRNCGGSTKNNKSIFIFLSNKGHIAITYRLLDKMNEGFSRTDTTLQDFENIIISETLNESGGFLDSLLIKSGVIDFFIPFLPLERNHVRLCIQEAYNHQNISPTPSLIEEVFEKLTFGPKPDYLFSIHGCKRVETMVGLISQGLVSDFREFNKDRSEL